MSLPSLLDDRHQVLWFYGTTPPRLEATDDQITTAATKLAARLRPLSLDGLIVYDVQDERARTAIPRPFPFLPTIDPRVYAQTLRTLIPTPIIAYKSVAQMTEDTWAAWLTETAERYRLKYLSIVGRAATQESPNTLPLPQAMHLAATHPAEFTVGGVVIPERHSALRSESQHLLHKARMGCRFFVSQAVYNPAMTIRVLRDYHHACHVQGVAPLRIVLTFTPCGRPKTMDFIKWLGVAIAEETEHIILADPAPLTKSIQTCCSNLRAILGQPYVRDIPLGINVESVSITKAEIDGSIDLFHALQDVVHSHLG